MDREQILLIITDLIKEVHEKRDIYVTIFITKENVALNIYADKDESEDK